MPTGSEPRQPAQSDALGGRDAVADALPRALLVDLDDTILAYDAVTEEAWWTVCRSFAGRLGIDAAALYAAVRRCSHDYWSDPGRHRWGRLHLDLARAELVGHALSDLGLEPAEGVRSLAGEIAAAYDRERTEAMYPLPGAIKALRDLADRGVRLGLLTNGNGADQRAKIERFGLEPLFDCIVIEGEFGVGKPDERVFRHALARLAALPQQAWMVGDDLERDVGGAQRVGIRGVWVDWRGAGLPMGSPIRPDRVVRALADLLEGGRP